MSWISDKVLNTSLNITHTCLFSNCRVTSSIFICFGAFSTWFFSLLGLITSCFWESLAFVHLQQYKYIKAKFSNTSKAPTTVAAMMSEVPLSSSHSFCSIRSKKKKKVKIQSCWSVNIITFHSNSRKDKLLHLLDRSGLQTWNRVNFKDL